jgi:hypothetical protein
MKIIFVIFLTITCFIIIQIYRRMRIYFKEYMKSYCKKTLEICIELFIKIFEYKKNNKIEEKEFIEIIELLDFIYRQTYITQSIQVTNKTEKYYYYIHKVLKKHLNLFSFQKVNLKQISKGLNKLLISIGNI